jgi:integrase
LPTFLCDIVQTYANALTDYSPDERLFYFTKHTLQKELKHGCVSPLLVSERLGHDNIETTLQTYSHLYPNKHSKIAQKLDDLIK